MTVIVRAALAATVACGVLAPRAPWGPALAGALTVGAAFAAAALVEQRAGTPRAMRGSAGFALLAWSAAGVTASLGSVNLLYAGSASHGDVLAGLSALIDALHGGALARQCGAVLLLCLPIGLCSWHRLELVRRAATPRGLQGDVPFISGIVAVGALASAIALLDGPAASVGIFMAVGIVLVPVVGATVVFAAAADAVASALMRFVHRGGGPRPADVEPAPADVVVVVAEPPGEPVAIASPMTHALEAFLGAGLRGVILGGAVAIIVGLCVVALRGATLSAAALTLSAWLAVATPIAAAAAVERWVSVPRSAASSAAVSLLAMAAACLAGTVAGANGVYMTGAGGIGDRLWDAQAAAGTAIETLAGHLLLSILVAVGLSAPLGIAAWHRLETLRRLDLTRPIPFPGMEALAVVSIALACAAGLLSRDVKALAMAIPLFMAEGFASLILLYGASVADEVALAVARRAKRGAPDSPAGGSIEDQPSRSAIALPTAEQDFSPPRS